ncbi:MAG: hypothetical protein HY774_25315 [Acidobacteria bacterium]|nr:hypothetical protein [Acidobacteriota bacterium]
MTELILFEKNRPLLEGNSALGIEIGINQEPTLLLAFRNDTPPDRQIELGYISVSTSGGSDIQFAGDKGMVTFKAGASAGAGMGIYWNSPNVINALALDEKSLAGFSLPSAATHYYSLLRWGYDVNASFDASVGLGYGTVSFGGDGHFERTFAVLRRFPFQTGIRTAFTGTVNSWKLPKSVQSETDLEPGTWLISAVDGSLGLNVGAQFGFDFNWVREAQLGGLTGDIGLRLQLGVGVVLGFSASGQFAIVVSRESLDATDQKIQVRVYKLKMRGWDFAFNAGARVEPRFELPKSADDLIAAVFGVQAEQVLKGLEEWTNPGHRLTELLGDQVDEYARTLLTRLTGLDTVTDARGNLLEFLEAWQILPHPVATVIWKIARDEPKKGSDSRLGEFQHFLAALSEGNEEAIQRELAAWLERVDFLDTPIGQWLSAFGTDGILTVLDNIPALQQLARATVRVFGGGETNRLLGGIFQLVQKFIEDTLKIDLGKLKEISTKADFDNLDLFLKGKLAEFLGVKLDQVFGKLGDIQKTIEFLLSKQEELYTKTLNTLRQSYDFNIQAVVQRSTTRTALIDVEFDFGAGDPALLRQWLHKAIAGDFTEIVLNPKPGVRLRKGVLTHEITRSSFVEVSLPYFSSRTTNLSKSLASLNAVDEANGRLLLYTLDATNQKTARINAHAVRQSSLTVGLSLASTGGQLVRHSQTSARYGYNYRQFVKDMKRVDFERLLEPWIEAYFPRAFGVEGKADFPEWVSVVDDLLEKQLDNGPGIVGDTLIHLEVSLPGNLVTAWLNTRPDKNDPLYERLSIRLQRKVKEVLAFYFLMDPKRYETKVPTQTLLVFASMPPIATNDKNYWDWRKSTSPVVQHPTTTEQLKKRLAVVKPMLQKFDKLKDDAEFYDPKQAEVLQLQATSGIGAEFLRQLLHFEETIVFGAINAAIELASFKNDADQKPEDAIESLAKFGVKVVETFHSNVGKAYGGIEINALQSLIFIEAAAVLADLPNPPRPNALLSLSFLNRNATITAEQIAAGENPTSEELALAERLIHIEG